ncbi:MAG: hypothetical protein Q9164_006484 [Protoblastenia rupestris]
MPSEDYTPTTLGALKLKSVHSSKISKDNHKKKKKKPKPQPDPNNPNQTFTSIENDIRSPTPDAQNPRPEEEVNRKVLEAPTQGKTEAQIRHEENRKRRLEERLKRVGTKTHKERVEDLNRYLSGLSLESVPDKTYPHLTAT